MFFKRLTFGFLMGLKHYNDPTAFFECSNTMDDVYEDIDNYNPKEIKKF